MASRLVSMVAPIMMKKIAEVAATVAMAESATLRHGFWLRFSHRQSKSEQSAAAAPASVGVKMPENMPPKRTMRMIAKPHTLAREVNRSRQVVAGRVVISAFWPRPTSFGAATPIAKMKAAKHTASTIPGRAPAMRAGPTGTEAMPA